MTSVNSDPTPTTAPPRTLNNFYVRIITGLILMPLVLSLAYIDGAVLAVLVSFIVVVGVLEFYVFAHGRAVQGSAITGAPMAILVVAAFYLQQPILWLAALVIGAVATFALETLRHPNDLRRTVWQVVTTLAGVLYVGFPISFLLAIRALPAVPTPGVTVPEGYIWLLLIFASTWATDSFAYLGGRAFGKTKLAPVLSPKKTVEGALIGVIGGIVAPLVILALTGKVALPNLVLIAVATPVAIAGDLLESAIKRYFQVKDSHLSGFNLFPGHGGVLDRIDALICVSTLYYLFLLFTHALG